MNYLVLIFGLILMALGAGFAALGVWTWQDWQYTLSGANLFAAGAIIVALSAVVTKLNALIATLKGRELAPAAPERPDIAVPLATRSTSVMPAPSGLAAALGVSAVSETLADHVEGGHDLAKVETPAEAKAKDQAELPMFDATERPEVPVVTHEAAAEPEPALEPVLAERETASETPVATEEHEYPAVEKVAAVEPAPIAEIIAQAEHSPEEPLDIPSFAVADRHEAPAEEFAGDTEQAAHGEPVMPPVPPPKPEHVAPVPVVFDDDADEMDWLDRALSGADEPSPAPISEPMAEKASEPVVPPANEEAPAPIPPPEPPRPAPSPEPFVVRRAPEPPIIGRYDAHGNTYVLYADGSIDAETPNGTFRFKSMAELKSFIEETIN